MLNLESEEEMKRVEMIAERLGVTARISIRVNPNIDPKTHPYISTGLHENKFDVNL
jgi:diaminopimelate decarboxylase